MTTHDTASVRTPSAAAPGAGPARRTVLGRGALAAVAGAGTLGLAGCTQQIRQEAAARSHYAGSEPTDLMAAADLPVGSSASVDADGRTLLLHRTDESTVVAFSATCTHQGCTVRPVERPEGPSYACPCHGSNFDVATGVPFGGPAKAPLTDYEASVQDGRIVVKL